MCCRVSLPQGVIDAERLETARTTCTLAVGVEDRLCTRTCSDGKPRASYSALFWMDFRDTYVAGKDSDDGAAYPYLGRACDHFHGKKK